MDDEFKALIDQFLADLSDRADELERAFAEENYDALQKIAHKIKGCAVNYGFPEQGKLATQLESYLAGRSASGPTGSDLGRHYTALLASCRQAKAPRT